MTGKEEIASSFTLLAMTGGEVDSGCKTCRRNDSVGDIITGDNIVFKYLVYYANIYRFIYPFYFYKYIFS